MSGVVGPSITSHWSLIAPIVDVQPAWNLIHVATAPEDKYQPETRAFARMKIEEAIRDLRKAAKDLNRILAEHDALVAASQKKGK